MRIANQYQSLNKKDAGWVLVSAMRRRGPIRRFRLEDAAVKGL